MSSAAWDFCVNILTIHLLCAIFYPSNRKGVAERSEMNGFEIVNRYRGGSVSNEIARLLLWRMSGWRSFFSSIYSQYTFQISAAEKPAEKMEEKKDERRNEKKRN